MSFGANEIFICEIWVALQFIAGNCSFIWLVSHRLAFGKLLGREEVPPCENEIAKPTPTSPLSLHSCHKKQ